VPDAALVVPGKTRAIFTPGKCDKRKAHLEPKVIEGHARLKREGMQEKIRKGRRGKSESPYWQLLKGRSPRAIFRKKNGGGDSRPDYGERTGVLGSNKEPGPTFWAFGDVIYNE